MAKITELTVERSYTLNLGNFESARLGASATVHLTEDDDPEEAYEQATEFIETKIATDMDVLKGDE